MRLYLYELLYTYICIFFPSFTKVVKVFSFKTAKSVDKIIRKLELKCLTIGSLKNIYIFDCLDKIYYAQNNTITRINIE